MQGYDDNFILVFPEAVKIGSGSNIDVKDIYEGCCGQGVLAVNFTPFTGGVDARGFSFVTSPDISQPSASLSQSLTRIFSDATKKALQPNESAIAPTCDLMPHANQNVGDQVSAVTVRVSGSCTSVFYSQYALQNEAEILLAQKAVVLGSHFMSLDGQHITILSSRLTIHGNSLGVAQVDNTGVWGYQFSKRQEESIKKLGAGKAQIVALQILGKIGGIAHASISGIGQSDMIPSDISHIHVVFLYFTQ